MTPEKLKQFIRQLTWNPIGAGSYNRAAVSTEHVIFGSFTGQLVIKYPHAENDYDSKELSKSSRGARKLTTIHPHYPVSHIDGYRLNLYFNGIPTDHCIDNEIVYLYLQNQTLEAAMIDSEGMIQRIPLNHLSTHQDIAASFKHLEQDEYIIPHHKLLLALEHEHQIFDALHLTREGLLLPYFGKKQATRDQIAYAVLDIYQRTRNIIMDACAPGNFLALDEEVILVDPDQAYDRNSPVSLAFFNDPEIKAACEKHFQKANAKSNGEDPVVAITKTLLYLESQLIDSSSRNIKTQYIIADEYVSYDMILVLHAFRKNNWPLDVPTLETLVLIIERCKNRNLTFICPEITPTFVHEVQQALLHLDKPTTHFIRQQLLAELKPTHINAPTPISVSKTSKANAAKPSKRRPSSNTSKTHTSSHTVVDQTTSSTQAAGDIDNIYTDEMFFDLYNDPLFQLSPSITAQTHQDQRPLMTESSEHRLPMFTSSSVMQQNNTTQLYQPRPMNPQASATLDSLTYPESLVIDDDYMQAFLTDDQNFPWNMKIPSPLPNTETFSNEQNSAHTKHASIPVESSATRTKHTPRQVDVSMFSSSSHNASHAKLTNNKRPQVFDENTIPTEDQHDSKKRDQSFGNMSW